MADEKENKEQIKKELQQELKQSAGITTGNKTECWDYSNWKSATYRYNFPAGSDGLAFFSSSYNMVCHIQSRDFGLHRRASDGLGSINYTCIYGITGDV